jgi:hypothetical protein
MSEATAIWSRSIAACAGGSVLGGIWVSLHFCWLAERANVADAQEAGAVEKFLAAQATERGLWRVSLRTTISDDELDRLIDEGLRFLQLFDSMSLWLCCSPATAAWDAALTGGGTLRFEPVTPAQIRVQPYPFTSAPIELGVAARRIAARPYASDLDLQSALSDASQAPLRWTLEPGGDE